MQESDLRTWLARTTRRTRAFAVGSGVVLVALVVGIPAVVLASVYVGFSRQFTSLLISALGALSTVLLVIVTLATFVENQVRLAKENQRALVREELQVVVQPSAAQLDTNRAQLRTNVVNWHRFDVEQWRNSTLLGFDLKPLRNRPNADRVVYERFAGREPEIATQFDDHDDQVERLATMGCNLVETLADPLAAYIEANDIQYQQTPDDSPAPAWIASYVLSDVAELPHSNRDRDVWAAHAEEFRAVANDVAPDELAEFRRMKREYLACVTSLHQALERTRGRLQREYSISLTDHPATGSNDAGSGYSAV